MQAGTIIGGSLQVGKIICVLVQVGKMICDMVQIGKIICGSVQVGKIICVEVYHTLLFHSYFMVFGSGNMNMVFLGNLAMRQKIHMK